MLDPEKKGDFMLSVTLFVLFITIHPFFQYLCEISRVSVPAGTMFSPPRRRSAGFAGKGHMKLPLRLPLPRELSAKLTEGEATPPSR